MWNPVVGAAANGVKITSDSHGSWEGDCFGSSVDIDGNYAVIGATAANKAYIFKGNGNSWTQQTKLSGSDSLAYDHFGNSVAISGKYAAVCAPQHDDHDLGCYSSGAVYIYQRTGTTWTQKAKLEGSEMGERVSFSEVALHEDYILVLAYEQKGKAVYIYKRTGTDWIYQARLVTPDSADNWFQDMAIHGDHVIIGASGVAWIFKRAGETWHQQARLELPDGGGYSVSIFGDHAAVSGNIYRSVYIYKKEDDSWALQAELTDPGGNTAVVSLTQGYLAMKVSDSIHIYKQNGESWEFQSKLTPTYGNTSSSLWDPLSITGGYVITANKDAGVFKGAAYIYTYGEDLGSPSYGSDCNDSPATLQGFDRGHYLEAKLAQTRSLKPEWYGKSIEEYECFLKTMGFTPESHYATWGHREGLSPNPYFDPAEYVQAKAVDMRKKWGYPNVETARAIFKSSWDKDPYLHYIFWGAGEGINPSNNFDEGLYLTDLLAWMQSYGIWTQRTVDDLRTYLSHQGMTVIDHYLNHGAANGLSPKSVSP